MKKIFILLLTVITTTFAYAQKTLSPDYDYTVSKPYKVVDAKLKRYFSNGKEVLSIKIRPKKNLLLLQKYDVDGMTEIGKKYYNDLPENYVYEGLIKAQEKYYFFYSSWTGKKTKHERLFYRELDFKTGTFKGKAKQIIDHDGKLVNFYNRGMSFNATTTAFGVGFSMNIKTTPKFDLMTSKDGSKILVEYRKKPVVRKDTKSWDIINVTIFDIKMKKQWNKQYKMPYTERRMNFLDNMIDNDGNVFILSKVYHDDSNKDKKRRKDKEANYHIELFKLNKSLNKIETSKISLEDKFINGISIYQANNKQIVCAGYYNKGKSLSSADGIFAYTIDQNGYLISKRYHEIPLEILNQHVKNRIKKKNLKNNKKGKAEAKYLGLNRLIIHDDGSLIFIGEVYYRVYHRSKNSVYYTYHYEDLHIAKVKPNGDLSWMKKIPKRQKGFHGKGGMSYTYFNANGYHYLIYLDNVKNFNLPLDKTPALHMDGVGGYLTAMKINDETGEATKGSILNFRKIKGDISAYQFKTNRITKIKDNSFFVEVYKKKKEDVFLKVEMKN